jgi:hypothetical protein
MRFRKTAFSASLCRRRLANSSGTGISLLYSPRKATPASLSCARPCARGKSLFARNRQIELIRDNCGIGKMDSRARSRKIPHPAIHVELRLLNAIMPPRKVRARKCEGYRRGILNAYSSFSVVK